MKRPTGKIWLRHTEYLCSLPTKHGGAGLVVLNGKGRILLVKPIYRNYWKLPGGSVDHFESPRDACVREAREELRLPVRKAEFLGVSYNTHVKHGHEDLQFYFYGGTVRKAQIDRMKARANEIEEYRFCTRRAAVKMLRRGSEGMLAMWFRAIAAGVPFYHERTYHD